MVRRWPVRASFNVTVQVGEVIGDGVLFQFNGTFNSARLCLDVGAFSKVYVLQYF